jgi:hypothetical protein
VNFTREPIIETIISPKEGYKLLVRSSKSGGPAEEYFVDAVEVVSFGRAFFFRSMERPKAFLVPTSDYEVLEVKETRVALKSATHERNIKIGGGRDASMRHQHREPPQEREAPEPMVAEEQPVQEETGLEAAIGARMEKRRDRRRRRHRRSEDDWSERRSAESQQQPQAEAESKSQNSEEETKVSSPMFSSLIPPPPNLISQTLSRYKDKEFVEGVPPEKEEKKQEKEPPQEEASGSEPLHRMASGAPSETLKLSSFTSTQFSLPQPDGDSFFF